MKSLSISTFTTFLALLGSTAFAAEKGPVNLDLELGELGKVPTGWFASEGSYKVQLSDEKPKAGKLCAVIAREGKDAADGFGNLMQSFDAAAYRGKRVRFKAAVRADVAGAENSAALWLRVDRKNDRSGFFDNMSDRPITKKDWNDYEIVGDVADDAESISLGVILIGNGKVAFDAASFEIVGKMGEGNDSPRALKDRGLENLIAFTKLFGYVRYFHPSDAAAATNWEKFAIDGIASVEGAKSAEELAKSLQRLFEPIAPTVKVYVTGQAPAAAEPVKTGTKVVAWYHYGVGVGNPQSVYSSKRINDSSLKRAAKWPDLNKPFTADLGGGVSCSVPLSLPADDNGTLPHTAAKVAPLSKPAGFIATGRDRDTRLADVMIAWNIFQHFYPYFDVVKVDWPAELKLALTAAATDKDENAFLVTLRHMMAALQDGHGMVYLATEGGDISQAPFGCDWIENQLVVTRVATKGAGPLKAGDVVLKINNRPALDVIAEQEKEICSATPQWKRHTALDRLTWGESGSKLSLEIQGADGKRQTVQLSYNNHGAKLVDLRDPRPEKIAVVKPGIMYVDLDRVTDEDFAAAIPQLEKAKGIIYDLRGYPHSSFEEIGHLIDKPITCAQWHIPTTMFPDRQEVTFQFSNWTIKPKKPHFDAKIAFLTDGRAISAAETYMGIIEHYKLAAIVGGPTAGTNGNVNPFTLPGGYLISWTGMKVLKHDGSRHHGIGIQPTVPVSRTIKGVAAGKDEVLEKAIEIVSP